MPTMTKQEEVLYRRAEEIVKDYRFLVEPARSGGYMGRALELPKVLAKAETQGLCMEEAHEHTVEAVAAILRLGRVPPRPSEKRLSEQVNIRLSPEEKHRAEEMAQQQGFRGLADFVRSLIVREVRD